MPLTSESPFDNSLMRKLHSSRHAREGGFSLVELMIALVVVAILSAIAFPTFMDSIRKGRRSEAFTALSAVQQAQERWRANNATYNADLSTAAPVGLGISGTTASGHYALTLSNVTATGYEATATATSSSSQASDGTCAKLSVQMAGGNIKYASNTAAGALTYASTDKCWSR